MFRRLDATGLRRLDFRLDGANVSGVEGQTVAAAILALGETVFHRAPESGAPRGPFCLMGVCFACVVEIDGSRQQACLVELLDGMEIVRRLT
jgi:aerobic-type carbon monoxide dehydrogenase small subunit (CoxS/CutS family)